MSPYEDDDLPIVGSAAYKRVHRAPSSAGNILSSVLRRHGLDKEFARYEFIASWTKIVGKAIAERAKPKAIRKNALVVEVQDSAWAQELSFQKHVIINRLNKFLGNEDIKDLVFYIRGKGVAGEIPRQR